MFAKGWKKIPCGDCEGFDHFENGCPGHPILDEVKRHVVRSYSEEEIRQIEIDFVEKIKRQVEESCRVKTYGKKKPRSKYPSNYTKPKRRK